MFTGSLAYGIYALGVILLCSSMTDALNMDNICKLLKNNAQIASGDSCSTFYSCINGVATLQNCPSGNYFDKNAQLCVSQAPASCVTTASSPCLGHAAGTFVAKPDSCNGYYYCSGSSAKVGYCPNGLIFNPTNQTCDYKSSYNCQETDANNADAPINLCSYIKVGVFFGNAFNCAGWMKCTSDNKYIYGECNSNLMYNVPGGLCDYASSTDCSQLTFDPQLDVPEINGGGTCSTSGEKKKAIACNQYYVCDGTNFQLATCSDNYYYDINSEKCLLRTEAYNDCDRCVGTTKEFVNAFGTDCHNYLYCSNGVSRGSTACPNDGFFNEQMGGCVAVNPDFDCCVTSIGTTSTPQT